jgi:hypothetical protein
MGFLLFQRKYVAGTFSENYSQNTVRCNYWFHSCLLLTQNLSRHYMRCRQNLSCCTTVSHWITSRTHCLMGIKTNMAQCHYLWTKANNIYHRRFRDTMRLYYVLPSSPWVCRQLQIYFWIFRFVAFVRAMVVWHMQNWHTESFPWASAVW